MPRVVKTIFKNSPTLYKFDSKDGSKKISNILFNKDYVINYNDQLIIKKLLGISNKDLILYTKSKNGLIYLKNNNNNYIVSILNNTFMIT